MGRFPTIQRGVLFPNLEPRTAPLPLRMNPTDGGIPRNSGSGSQLQINRTAANGRIGSPQVKNSLTAQNRKDANAIKRYALV